MRVGGRHIDVWWVDNGFEVVGRHTLRYVLREHRKGIANQSDHEQAKCCDE